MMAGDKTKRDEWLGVGEETERWGRPEFVDEVTDERGSRLDNWFDCGRAQT